METASLIVDFPDRNADLLYATGFSAPDAIIYFEYKGKRHLVLSDLEITRAQKQARVHRVLSLSHYSDMAKRRVGKTGQLDVLDTIFRSMRINRLIVPETMPAGLVDGLRKRRYEVELHPIPFYPARHYKTTQEKKAIDDAQRTTFQAIALVEKILRASDIRRGYLYYKGKILTSERVRAELASFFMERGFTSPDGMIVACGVQATDPHEHGSGPLRPHQAIVADLYPRSQKTFYFGDASRTFCRGKAPPRLKHMYDTVCAAQSLGLRLVRARMNGKTVHTAIQKYFEAKGYKTGHVKGRVEGFFHSTGHGLGMEVHEIPQRIGPRDYTLEAGHVFSIEPGLYYKDIGGVRIEDLVFITKNGCDVLGGSYPRRLEI